MYGYRVHNPDKVISDMGWDMQPADIEHVLERLHHQYKLPVLHRKWLRRRVIKARVVAAENYYGMQRALAEA